MEQLSEDIFRLQIPLPFPLKYLNSYAIKGDNGWTIIDTGLHMKETEELWGNFLREQKSNWQDIEKIILTHYHPDHFGSAGWLQEKSGAPVYMSETDYNEAYSFWFSEQDMGFIMRDFYSLHGMDNDLAENMIIHLKEFLPWVSPKPNVTFIQDKDSILIGNDMYMVIATPGHSDGHLCFYQPEKRILFSGDHILPKITPNVSLWPKNTDRNPLKRFLESLMKINRLDVNTTYPAHKANCLDVKKRISEILNHHEERLNHVLNWIGNGATGYQVCQQMFGSNLSIHQLRFAMAETLAHIVFLEDEQKIYQKSENGVIIWYKTT